MLYVLGGLDGHFESMVTIITNKKWFFTLDELFTWMRTHDKQMERLQMSDSQHVQAKYLVIKQPYK